jgi:hypothetical protein
MLYSYNQVALYLNLAAARVAKDGHLGYLTGSELPKVSGGGHDHQETQILFVNDDALWVANNDDADTLLQKAILEKLHIGTPEALIDHVQTYQTRVFKRRKNGASEIFTPRTSPAEILLAELVGTDYEGNKRVLHDQNDYPAALWPLPAAPLGGKKSSGYSLQSSGATPALSGIVFITGRYEGKSGTGDNEHAEQKLLAALSRLPDNVRGRLDFYGCKQQCQTCKGVFDEAKPRLLSSYRFLVCTAHDDAKVDNYQAQAHPSNIKALDVDHYFPAPL